MGMLTREAGRQIYFEHYAGRGPTVVLSHGWGMGCRAWDDTIARLTDRGHAVVAYDHRGCGRSDKDFADVSIDALGSPGGSTRSNTTARPCGPRARSCLQSASRAAGLSAGKHGQTNVYHFLRQCS